MEDSIEKKLDIIHDHVNKLSIEMIELKMMVNSIFLTLSQQQRKEVLSYMEEISLKIKKEFKL